MAEAALDETLLRSARARGQADCALFSPQFVRIAVGRSTPLPKRPYLVLPDRVCVPLDGDWRVVQLRGNWYVLGHDSVVPCGSQRAADGMLEELQSRSDVDLLASEAISGLDRIPNSWETDSLRESDPS